MTRDEQPEPPCLVAVAPCCGRTVFAAVLTSEGRKTAGREAAACIRAGYRIETRTCAEVRQSKWGCDCDDSTRASAGVEPRKKRK